MSDEQHNKDDELIVAQTDGELLRGAEGLSADDVQLVQTAVALSSLLTSDADSVPVYVDVETPDDLLFTAAFDDEFVIAAVNGRTASRTEFVERARALYFE